MTDPIRAAAIPADITEAASSAFILTEGSERDKISAAVAAALNLAREQIAEWVGGPRVLTNGEMSAIGRTGDPGEVYVAYAARMVRCWPEGYR